MTASTSQSTLATLLLFTNDIVDQLGLLVQKHDQLHDRLTLLERRIDTLTDAIITSITPTATTTTVQEGPLIHWEEVSPQASHELHENEIRPQRPSSSSSSSSAIVQSSSNLSTNESASSPDSIEAWATTLLENSGHSSHKNKGKHVVRDFSEEPTWEDATFHDFTCSICMQEYSPNCLLLTLRNCTHTFCYTCLKATLMADIQERRYPLICPLCRATRVTTSSSEDDTLGVISPMDVDFVLGDTPQELERVESLQMQYLQTHDDRFVSCAGTDCKEIFFVEPHTFYLECPTCEHAWCRVCGETNVLHADVNCDRYKRLLQEHKEAGENAVLRAQGETRANQGLQELLAKNRRMSPCPKCKTLIEKISGCNHMTCTVCKSHFCLVCRQALNASGVGNHYSSRQSACYNQQFSDTGSGGTATDEEDDY